MTLPEDLRKKIEGKLLSNEKVIWKGQIAYTFFSSPIFNLALLAAAAFTIWALAGYVPSQGDSGFREQSFKVTIRPALIVLLFVQIFVMLERRAVTSGRATGDIILTNRRLLRVCSWPKLRVRGLDYLSKRVSGFGGVIWVGEFGWIVLAPSDAAQVRCLIDLQKSEAPA